MAILEMETCVRGFHVYKAIWEAAVREEPEYRRERGNRVDCYAVAIVKDEGRVWQLFLSRWSEVLWQCHVRTVRMSS